MQSKNSLIDIKKSRILVTGGSGSLGRHIIKTLLQKGARNITSVSRDEGLIKEAEYYVNSKYVNFKVGDISDPYLIKYLLKDIDIVFHTAALKHVSLAEKYPREVYRVNVKALLNLLDCSESVSRFVHVSSDKAIGVMNCYGATKLLGEYLVRETNNLNKSNKYIVIRCPNFIGSRGSVTDVWKSQINELNEIRVTDPSMTRYFCTLPDASNYIVVTALMKKLSTDKIYYPVKITKKYLLKDLSEAFVDVFGDKKTKIKVMGKFAGEKKHEDYIKDIKLISKKELKSILETLKL